MRNPCTAEKPCAICSGGGEACDYANGDSLTRAEWETERHRRGVSEAEVERLRAEVVALKAEQLRLEAGCRAAEQKLEQLAYEHAQCDDAIGGAVDAEREACATLAQEWDHVSNADGALTAALIKTAIQSRGA
jgi:chromosome segregation ATPase